MLQQPISEKEMLESLRAHKLFVQSEPRQRRPIGGEPSKIERVIAPLTFFERVGAAAAMHWLRPEQSFSEYYDQWVDYTDVVEYTMPDASDLVKMGLSFALGVGLDPLTYTGLGGLTKVGKAARATGKTFRVFRETIDEASGLTKVRSVKVPFRHLTKTEQANEGLRGLYTLRIPFSSAEWVPGGDIGTARKAASAFYNAMEKTGQTLKNTPGMNSLITWNKRAFKSRTGSRVGDEKLLFAGSTGEAAVLPWRQRAANARLNIVRMAREEGISRDDLPALLSSAAHYVETVGKEATDVVTSKVGKYAVDELRAIKRGFENLEDSFNLNVYRYGDGETSDYLPHVVSGRESVQWLNQAGLPRPGSGVLEYSARHQNMLQRELRMPIREANEYMRKQGFEGDFFVSDPFEAYMHRANRAGRAIRDRVFIDDLLKHVRGQRQLATFKAGRYYVRDRGKWRMLKQGEENEKAVRGLEVVKSILKGKRGRWGAHVEGGHLSRWVAQAGGDLGLADEVIDEPLKRVDQLTDAVRHADEDAQLRFYKSMENTNIHIMPDEIAGELSRVKNFMNDDEAIEGFLKTFDSTQNWWKAWTLGIFPAYHFRNVVDDTWRNSLAGINPFSLDPFVGPASRQSYAKAGSMMYDLRTAEGDLSNKGMAKIMGLAGGTGQMELRHADKSYQIYLQSAMNRGVINMRNVGMEVLPEDILKPFISRDMSSFGRWVGTKNPALQYALKLGAYRENTWRLAHYNYKVLEGIRDALPAGGRVGLDDVLSGATNLPRHTMESIMDEAALSVKRTMFNYQELTKFERNVMKRAFPFYSFFRNNLPFQLQEIVRQPGKFVGIDKARRSWEMTQPPRSDPRALSDWMKMQYPVKFGEDPETGVEKYSIFTSYISSMDLLRFLEPNNLPHEAWGMLSPIPKEIISQFMNYDPFFRQAIVDYPGERREVGPLLLDARLAHVLQKLRLVTETQKLLFDVGEGGLPLEDRAARFLTGFKLYPNDPVRGMSHYQYELEKLLSEARSALRRNARRFEAGRYASDRNYEKQVERLLEVIQETSERPIELPRIQ